jgi:superkiller protein 3
MGQMDDAIAQYRKAVEINPNYADAYSNLGLALFQKGESNNALDAFQRALEINPAQDNLARAEQQAGQK